MPARSECLAQLVAKVLEKDVPALTGQQPSDIPLLILHMIEHVRDDHRRIVGVMREIVTPLVCHILEHMGKHILAHGAQEHILRLEMRVERAAPDIGSLDDLLHDDVFIALVREEFLKCGKDCLSRLFAASLHKLSLSISLT